MPKALTANDAGKHDPSLTDRQRTLWVRVANNALRACNADDPDCEGKAARLATEIARRAPIKSIKVGPDGELSILAVPFGGPVDGRDLDGEYFSERTDLCLDWFPTQRPLLYGHGLDDQLSVTPIGKVDVTTATKEESGWWVRAQLDQSSRYWRQVRDLLEADEDALFASSGAYGHLVQKSKDGEILRWPWVELSLTPVPSNFYATVAPADAKAHYKAAGLATPPVLDVTEHRLADAIRAALNGLATEPPPSDGAALDIKDAFDWSRSMSAAEHGEHALTGVQSFAGRLRSLADLRGEDGRKEGRVLSEANRTRLGSLAEAMRAVLADVDDLLTATERRQAEAAIDAVDDGKALAAAVRRTMQAGADARRLLSGVAP